ncbi:hypothetical protein C8R47DRAFT_1219140 [Mycena vitilis]|nr:hypothetical protein C8R47DRAFT_1219140 [Mycena vitilis]
MSPPDITTTFGALLAGALFASVLAGLSNLQTVLYYRSYRKDPIRVKILVFGIWLLDNAHTGVIWAGVWYYFIWNYGALHKIDYIPCFLIHRIFLLSHRNWYMTGPAIALTCSRLVFASITTFRMLDYQSFEMLQLRARCIFTLGLAVSSAVDILIASLLVYLFRWSRTEAGGINHVLDKLILYGLESGSLTW